MFAIAVPAALQALERASHLLDPVAASGRTDALLGARLAPGMFDFSDQIAVTAGFALRTTLPLCGFPRPEARHGQDLAGLRETLERARRRIQGLTPRDFEGAETRMVRHRAGLADLSQDGRSYLVTFALPNLWFHLSMAFAILRAEGVAVGKADFDGLHAYPTGFAFGDD